MCGIVGLFIKNPHLEGQLGKWVAPMLVEMSERGPDSAGLAIYREPVAAGETKLTLMGEAQGEAWQPLTAALAEAFGPKAHWQPRGNHLVVTVPAQASDARAWLEEHYPQVRLTSLGSTIEIYKAKGSPAAFVEAFDVKSAGGSHAIGHTRMATESAVTTQHSHPFSTGLDLCLVHNGSLSNHNRLRQVLRGRGIPFQTDNDSEVAAGYLMDQLRQGNDLETALTHALKDLDGFYTFAIGTQEGFAVLRDPFGCKPAVLAETDDWVAMASEFRAIATLPGVEHAELWEPVPEQIYSWRRG
ncbi:MAG: class II glutamine amidotransferase [Candidatus Competibacterales bacterium]